MTITRRQLAQAAALQAEYDTITTALSILADPGAICTITLASPSLAGVTLALSNVPGSIQTMLTNRQTAIATQLTSLGVPS